MAAGTIISAWSDATRAYLAVAVDEGGQAGRVEYVGSVPLSALAGLTNAQKKAALVAAVKAVRDAQQTTTTADATLSGAVTI